MNQGLLTNEPIINAAREWLKDCVWRDIDEDGIDEATASDVLAAVDRHYEGGIVAFVRDQEPTEGEPDPT